jgi:hypothetical protein
VSELPRKASLSRERGSDVNRRIFRGVPARKRGLIAAAFYTQQAGFTLDVDYHPALGFRVVQLTPPGSACSIQFGDGLADAPPASTRATYLAVTDIEAARQELTGRMKRPVAMTGRRPMRSETAPAIGEMNIGVARKGSRRTLAETGE